MINAKTKLCCIIGNPVEHSLSPQMHNAAFRKLELNYIFLAFKVENVKAALEGFRSIVTKGIVVTIPHKLSVMKYVDEIDEIALKIGAVNAIVNVKGKLNATNTDCGGAIDAMEENINLKGKKISLLGAGGAARAVAYGLKMKRAKVYIYNRTLDSAKKLVNDFSLDGCSPLRNFKGIRNSDVIINATSVGMAPNEEQSPIPSDCITSNHLVFDIVYAPHHTKLIKYAKAKKAKIIYGYKMVLYGGMRIFEFFTGKKAPKEVLEKTLLSAISK